MANIKVMIDGELPDEELHRLLKMAGMPIPGAALPPPASDAMIHPVQGNLSPAEVARNTINGINPVNHLGTFTESEETEEVEESDDKQDKKTDEDNNTLDEDLASDWHKVRTTQNLKVTQKRAKDARTAAADKNVKDWYNSKFKDKKEVEEQADYDYGINPTSRKGFKSGFNPYDYEGTADEPVRTVPARSGDNPLKGIRSANPHIREDKKLGEYLKEVECKKGKPFKKFVSKKKDDPNDKKKK